MLLQRLVADRPRQNTSGFQYDYMGSAEFEFGATREARVKLAKIQIEKNLGARQVRLFVKWGRSTYGPVNAYVFGAKETINQIVTSAPSRTKVLDDLVLSTDKENPRLDDEKIIAWMSVHSTSPILIMRATDDNIKRGNQFLQGFMTGILEEENKAREQKVYRYINGWTLKLINGPILALHDDAPPVEGGERWVLFDETGKALEQCDYFDEHAERRHRFIGEPINTED